MQSWSVCKNGDFVSVQIIGQAPDWREVVAVFASKTAGAEDGVDVFTLDEDRVELLRQVFWDMCEITTATQTVDVPDSDPTDDVDDSHTGIALTITITAKTAEQMRLIYAFTKYQNDALDILLENLGSLNIPMGSLTISQEDAIALLENLPDDLDPARKAVVETAVQLVGRVSYFWGGKSLTLGWDDRWGVPTEVTAAGSGSIGTVRPFGLDCSGVRRLDILQCDERQLLSRTRRWCGDTAQLLHEYLMERCAAGRPCVLS